MTQAWPPHHNLQVREGGPNSKLHPCAIRTTLIIVPSNLLGQWGEEVKKHFQARRGEGQTNCCGPGSHSCYLSAIAAFSAGLWRVLRS